jgi:hypothetical protein
MMSIGSAWAKGAKSDQAPGAIARLVIGRDCQRTVRDPCSSVPGSWPKFLSPAADCAERVTCRRRVSEHHRPSWRVGSSGRLCPAHSA